MQGCRFARLIAYDGGMERPSDKRLLTSAALVCIGTVVFFFPRWLFDTEVSRIFVGPGLIGAAFGNLYRRPLLGALCGVLVEVAFVAARHAMHRGIIP